MAGHTNLVQADRSVLELDGVHNGGERATHLSSPEDIPRSARLRTKPLRTTQIGARTVPTVIVNDNALARRGLEHVLGESGFRVVAAHASLDELADKTFDRQCVLVIAASRGISAILPALSALKAADRRLAIVLLADHLEPGHWFAAVQAGADAVLLANEIGPDVLRKTIELVMTGNVVVSLGAARRLGQSQGLLPQSEDLSVPTSSVPAVAGSAPSPLRDCRQDARLSEREQTILNFLTRGASNKQIARELNITEGTVKVHIKSLLRKISVRNRTQAAMWAINSAAKETAKEAVA